MKRKIRVQPEACMCLPGSEVRNLRPVAAVDGSTDLEAVRPRAVYPTETSCRPLCSSGPFVLTATGCILKAFNNEDGFVAPLSTLDTGGEILCAVATGGGAAVMTADGLIEVTVGADGKLERKKRGPEYPGIGLRAVGSLQVSATVRERALSKSYAATQSLAATDRRNLVSDLEEAYLTLCSSASSAGVFLQPVLARYRLVDASGRMLFESAPVLLSHPEGSQCDEAVTLRSTDGANVSAYTLTGKTWFPEVDIPAGLGNVDVEIWMSPMFHPYNPSLPAPVGITRGNDGSFALIRLPGAHCGLSGRYSGASCRRLMDAIAHIDTLLVRVATLRAAEGVHRPACTPDPDASGVAASIAATLKEPVRKAGARRVRLGMPHGFSASCVASAGSAVAWGDIRVRPYEGYPLRCMAASAGTADCEARVEVLLVEGAGVQRPESYTGFTPLSLGALLCYPSPDARELRVQWKSGGEMRRAVYPLVPDPSGRFAVYISPDLLPVVPPLVSAAPVGELADATEHLPGMAVLASAEDVAAVRTYAEFPDRVNALVASGGGEQSWEFGRSRFMAGTAGGIWSLVGGSGLRDCSVRLVARGEVGRADAMIADGDKVYAIRNGRFCVAEARGRVMEPPQPGGYVMLAADVCRGEVFCFRDDGSADVFLREWGWRYYSSSLEGVGRTAEAGGRPYAVGDDFVAVLDETDGERVEIAFSGVVVCPRRVAMRLGRVVLDARGEDVDIALQAFAAAADGERKRSLFWRRMTGDLRGIMPVACFGAPSAAFSVELRGYVKGGLRLHGFELEFTECDGNR